VTLTIDDVIYEAANAPGFAAETGARCTVALDITLTPELIEEGFVNEVVSKIQQMRKEAGFDVMDNIGVTFRATERLTAVIARNAASIMADTLAVSLTDAEPAGFVKEWNINGEEAKIGAERL